jgi:hypothetical protein
MAYRMMDSRNQTFFYGSTCRCGVELSEGYEWLVIIGYDGHGKTKKKEVVGRNDRELIFDYWNLTSLYFTIY